MSGACIGCSLPVTVEVGNQKLLQPSLFTMLLLGVLSEHPIVTKTSVSKQINKLKEKQLLGSEKLKYHCHYLQNFAAPLSFPAVLCELGTSSKGRIKVFGLT